MCHFCARTVSFQQHLMHKVTSLLGYPHTKSAMLSIFLLLINISLFTSVHGWLGSRVVNVLDSGTEGLGSNRSRDAVR